MSQCTFGNFPGNFGIFRIFFVAYMNYLASSRLFFSLIMNSENKRNSIFLLAFSFILFSPHLLLAHQSEVRRCSPDSLRRSLLQLGPAITQPTTLTRQPSRQPARESPSGPRPRPWPVSMADTPRTPLPPVPLACAPGQPRARAL
jgi:hypothetical protein